jgi:hypothetical protein
LGEPRAGAKLVPGRTTHGSKRRLRGRLKPGEVQARIRLVRKLDKFIETFDRDLREHRRLLDHPDRAKRKSWSNSIWVAFHDRRFSPEKTGVNMDELFRDE